MILKEEAQAYFLFGVADLYPPTGVPSPPDPPGVAAPFPGYPYPPYRFGLALTGRLEASPPS